LKALGREDEANDAFEKAIELGDRSIKSNSKEKSAWFDKGAALYSQGKYNESIQCFDEIIEIAPRYYRSWYYKGLALQKLGHDAEAEDAFAKAEELGYKS
ncbi:MAG: tetratricopeptide repeat protein, partial [Methanothrix sp.]